MTLYTGYVTRTTRETTTDKYTNIDNKNIVMWYFESVSLLRGKEITHALNTMNNVTQKPGEKINEQKIYPPPPLRHLSVCLSL